MNIEIYDYLIEKGIKEDVIQSHLLVYEYWLWLNEEW